MRIGMGMGIGMGIGIGIWGRFRLPCVTSGALVIAVVLLVLSGCVTQKSAGSAGSTGSPVPTQGAGGSTLVATLTPEKPNTSGKGTAQVQLDSQKQEVCYTIHVSGIELPATATHIHQGAAGVNGPVVVPFTPPNAQGVSTGCVKASPNLITTITQHPADYYVNVHNAPYPDGALRGQLAK